MSNTIVIFGASGDLTSRKLMPALYRQFQRGNLPENAKVVGVSRSPFSSEDWRTQLAKSTEQFAKSTFDAASWEEFANSVFYVPCDIAKPEDFENLHSELASIESKKPTDRVYYLSTMPQLYAPAIEQLGAAGLADDSEAERRVVIEKPFGIDLKSARELNERIHKVFREDQIYRIDHYLGKETVQNIMVLRFGNSIFEPLWNRNYIEHVEITVAEEVLVGRRGDYYDKSGILRDMFQNHILQLLMIIAMESPNNYDATMVRDEKVKVLKAVREFHGSDFSECGLRGQYKGYLQEEGVPPDSQTETYAALKLYVDNWRWRDVPFFLRSGKGMSCRSTQIVIQFRDPPHLLFNQANKATPEANRLIIQIQPAEGIQLHFQTKVPNMEMKLRQSQLDFNFVQNDQEKSDAYQRLLIDAINGDASLFARSDEVERAWEIIDPIIAAWRSPAAPDLLQYEPGLWGPDKSIQWIESQKGNWFDVCPKIT